MIDRTSVGTDVQRVPVSVKPATPPAKGRIIAAGNDRGTRLTSARRGTRR